MLMLPTIRMLIDDNSDADLVDSHVEMVDSDADYEDNADDN